MQALINNVTHSFTSIFGYAPTHFIQAPGRTMVLFFLVPLIIKW